MMWEPIRSFFQGPRQRFPAASAAALGEEALYATLRDFPDAAVVYDTNFTILAMNRAAESLFGIREEELRGMRLEPDAVERPHTRLFAQTLFPSLAPRSVERSETGAWPQIVTLTLENPHRELLAYTIRLEHGADTPATFVKIVRDETRTQGALARENEFVGIAAHQLRTPLTALRWSLESIGSAKPEDQTPLLKESLNLVDRCLKIVNDFLDAARIEEGKFGFEYRETNLVELLQTLLETIAPIAARYEVRVNFVHEGLASLTATVDSARLSTAFLNLLDNAVRYNVKGGQVTVTLRADATHATIAVADTGIGIPKGEERKIFQKLERGSNAVQVEPNGSGLGLYIAKNIIEGHGGTITAVSEVERGTTFTISLPLNRKSEIPNFQS